MLRFSKLLIAVLPLLLLLSCGKSGLLFIEKSSISETQLLKEECARINLDGQEIREADSLLQQAQISGKKGNHEEAYLLSEMAGARYSLALTLHKKIATSQSYLDAKDSKKSTEEKVEMHKLILENMRSSRGP